MTPFDNEKTSKPFGGVGKRVTGDIAKDSVPPRSGHDVTSGFLALDKMRAEHNGWTEENPPRLERVARVIKLGGR